MSSTAAGTGATELAGAHLLHKLRQRSHLLLIECNATGSSCTSSRCLVLCRGSCL